MPRAVSALAGDQRQRSDAAERADGGMPLTPVAVLAQTTRQRGDARAPIPLDPTIILAQSVDRISTNRDDRSAFWAIWLAHRDDLVRHSMRFSGGNHAEAEDALSEAMLKAAQAYPTTAVREPRAWLLRLVFNACIDRHRRHRRQDRAMQDVAVNGGARQPAADRSVRSPEELLDGAQQINDLERALRTLPPLLAGPLMLYLDEMSDADIAARLKVTREVVRKRRQMARDWLRRRIA